jgi:hypothetical protein
MPDWVTEPGIPCFRPHVRREKGKVLYQITPADLAEIATNSNTLTVHLHGSKPPITEGHRDFRKDAKEADQPLVLGYSDNYRPGEIDEAQPDGTVKKVPVILCDRHYMGKDAPTATRHPYTSVDYLPTRKAIVGLAKLTSPPELNLGGVFYPGTSDPVYVYAAGADLVDEPDNKATAGNSGIPDLTPEEQTGSEKVYKYLCAKYAWMGHAAKQYDAAVASATSAPQGDNTHVPDAGGKKKDEEEKPVENKAAVELVQKYEAIRTELEGTKVDRLLDGLERVEGYQFDRDAERARLIPLDEPARDKRLIEIRKYHQKVGGSSGIEVYRGNVETPQTGEITKDQADLIVKYASKHDCGYEDAKAAVLANKK